MKVRAKELSNTARVEILDALYTAAGTVRGRDSAKQFMRDLLTESERIMLGRRILVARALLAGSTYDDIVHTYSVGKDTINRITHWLEDQLPGYENVIADMEKELASRQKKPAGKKSYATSALYRLKKKYPLHFLLFPTQRSK